MTAIRYLTAGESHGPALTVIIEGIVAGLPITTAYINTQLARRQKGYGRGGRMAIEKDQATILSGIRGGKTLGSPISLQIENRDWVNWQEIMSPHGDARTEERQVTCPRPGHADLSGAIKYGHRDMRNILERSSARETAARVAAGAVARGLLEAVGIKIYSHVLSIGNATNPKEAELYKEATAGRVSWQELQDKADASQVHCSDSSAEATMIAAIDKAKAEGDSLGGIIEIAAVGLPVGLGSYSHDDRRLDSQIAGAMMSIQAIKGVEIGLGFESARQIGSQVHDPIYHKEGKGYYRQTNRAGGIEGGMSNSEPIIIRIAMKPIPTLYQPLDTIDITNRQPVKASVERSDTCAVPAAAIVAEAQLALVLAQALLTTTGGDRLEQIQERVQQMHKDANNF
ncbi:chorismate synthase [Heliorestis acidaminivorans]|uniref:Chorismate synthase n=1 Tax=Heliorestis acidaminivorans TaxID=553427 RepID=A0A6I0EXS6_9FIRM|nr:chorismate synthase [Heliorestis acidaminivorans]KAB2951320.1 chorismate synthase [Heliorestis acidaminivorans]